MPCPSAALRTLPLALALACAGEPVEADTCAQAGLDYATAGGPFLTTYCRSCHSVDSPERRGAPAGVDFDTEAQALRYADAIARTVLEDGSMPVGGGVPERDLERLRGWLACTP